METSYRSSEDTQEHVICELPQEPAELTIPVGARFIAPVEGNGELEGEDGIRILHDFPNFYVIAASQPVASEQANGGTTYRGVLRERPRHSTHQVAGHFGTGKRFALRFFRLLVGQPFTDTLATRDTVAVPVWLETIVVIVGLTVTFATHAVNMFNYPHYEQDEGTYMMGAWAITHGMITPYAYGYGHPPLAWIQIAAWVKLTGGFFTFGDAINSGRVLVLLYALGCTFLVYQIARRMTGSFSAGLLALIIFSLSPLSITFQREVLLDNFATFWFLLSLFFIVAGKSNLLYTMAAAICFGFAILSKEIIVILLPALIYAAWLHTGRFQRTFTLVTFSYIVVGIASSFVLMAFLKDEFFPYSWHLPWDHHTHLSMLDTYLWQVNRGQSVGSIRDSWDAWIKGDPLLIALGIIAPAFNLILGRWSRKHLLLAFFAFSFWTLLVRGGVVFAFYIIPLIPLIAFNTALAINTIAHWISRFVRFDLVRALLILGVLAAVVHYDIPHLTNPYNLFTLRPTTVQQEATLWIRAHVSRRAFIVINSNIYVDLHEPDGQGVGDGTSYPYANVYWNAALDPALHDTLLKKNWDRIDYIVADSEMLHDIKTYGGQMEIIHQALNHSVLRITFTGDNYEFVQIYQVIHSVEPPVP